MVTTAKATPTAPMETYVVGSLEPDGIAEFDVTFVNPESNIIDLVVSYKDSDGNPYSTTVPVTLQGTIVSDSSSSPGDGSPLGIIIAAVIILLIAGCAAVAWRRGFLDDIRKK